MTEEKKTDEADEEKPFEPVTLAAGIPWLPGRGNTLRSDGEQTGSDGERTGEAADDASGHTPDADAD